MNVWRLAVSVEATLFWNFYKFVYKQSSQNSSPYHDDQWTNPATKKQSMGHTLGSVTHRLVFARSFGVIKKGQDQDV